MVWAKYSFFEALKPLGCTLTIHSNSKPLTNPNPTQKVQQKGHKSNAAARLLQGPRQRQRETLAYVNVKP